MFYSIQKQTFSRIFDLDLYFFLMKALIENNYWIIGKIYQSLQRKKLFRDGNSSERVYWTNFKLWWGQHGIDPQGILIQ